VTRDTLPWHLAAIFRVVLRCLPSMAFEQFDFDSDQAHPPRAVTLALTAALALWAGVNVSDSARILHEYATNPPPNEHRVLADWLLAHHIRYGRANYWDAYVVDFLSRERVILAPTAVMRISSYDARVNRNAANAVDVVRQPCDTEARVASWCVDDPLHR
jgi:hypothetical protein